jgi:hypothetical protein
VIVAVYESCKGYKWIICRHIRSHKVTYIRRSGLQRICRNIDNTIGIGIGILNLGIHSNHSSHDTSSIAGWSCDRHWKNAVGIGILNLGIKIEPFMVSWTIMNYYELSWTIRYSKLLSNYGGQTMVKLWYSKLRHHLILILNQAILTKKMGIGILNLGITQKTKDSKVKVKERSNYKDCVRSDHRLSNTLKSTFSFSHRLHVARHKYGAIRRVE